MIEALTAFDIQFFKWIHLGLANDVFDYVLPIIRNKYTWIPLYLLFVFFIFKKYRWKGVILLIIAGLSVTIADQVSASVIKPMFERLRPCNNPDLSSIIRPLVDCGSGYSFLSSHATNHTALAVLFTWFFNANFNYKKFHFIFYSWAALICLAQVYVGVHYPLDVISGAILGFIIGKLMLMLQTKLLIRFTSN
ncbi:phosphatase PAP2 family protein [bacterium]|nr:phosphatase PAP2 family protein [bacterium]